MKSMKKIQAVLVTVMFFSCILLGICPRKVDAVEEQKKEEKHWHRGEIPNLSKMEEPANEDQWTAEDNKMWCSPQQIHLSLGNESDSIVVMWATRGKCSTVVRYAPHPWKLDSQANGSSIEIQSDEDKTFKHIHKAVLTHLAPSTDYYYRALSNNVGGGPYYFKTMPAGKDWSPKILLTNRLSLAGVAAKTVVDEVLSGSYTAVFYNDHIEPALKTPAGSADEPFMSELKEMTALALIPFMTGSAAAGEQEAEMLQYTHRFSMPGLKWPMSASKLWYSFDLGPVHVVSYATDVFFESDSVKAKAQQDWLVKDLTEANKNREATPWIIAIGYHPMYCSFGNQTQDDCSKNMSKVRHGLEDMFYHFAVDLVVESQEGEYERTWPHYKGVKVSSYNHPKAPVEVILSSSQKEEGPDFVNVTTAEWAAYHTSPGLSYVSLTVSNRSHLEWQLRSAKDNSVLDSFWIVQESHGNFSLASLPHNVSHQINQTIISQGGKPGTYDFIGGTGSPKEGEGWSKYSLWLGLGLVAIVVVLVVGVVGFRTCLRKRRSLAGRRWREMDRDGGAGNFYSVASDTDTDDNDFEIDMYDKTNKQSSKLLTSY